MLEDTAKLREELNRVHLEITRMRDDYNKKIASGQFVDEIAFAQKMGELMGKWKFLMTRLESWSSVEGFYKTWSEANKDVIRRAMIVNKPMEKEVGQLGKTLPGIDWRTVKLGTWERDEAAKSKETDEADKRMEALAKQMEDAMKGAEEAMLKQYGAQGNSKGSAIGKIKGGAGKVLSSLGVPGTARDFVSVWGGFFKRLGKIALYTFLLYMALLGPARPLLDLASSYIDMMGIPQVLSTFLPITVLPGGTQIVKAIPRGIILISTFLFAVFLSGAKIQWGLGIVIIIILALWISPPAITALANSPYLITLRCYGTKNYDECLAFGGVALKSEKKGTYTALEIEGLDTLQPVRLFPVCGGELTCDGVGKEACATRGCEWSALDNACIGESQIICSSYKQNEERCEAAGCVFGSDYCFQEYMLFINVKNPSADKPVNNFRIGNGGIYSSDRIHEDYKAGDLIASTTADCDIAVPAVSPTGKKCVIAPSGTPLYVRMDSSCSNPDAVNGNEKKMYVYFETRYDYVAEGNKYFVLKESYSTKVPETVSTRTGTFDVKNAWNSEGPLDVRVGIFPEEMEVGRDQDLLVVFDLIPNSDHAKIVNVKVDYDKEGYQYINLVECTGPDGTVYKPDKLQDFESTPFEATPEQPKRYYCKYRVAGTAAKIVNYDLPLFKVTVNYEFVKSYKNAVNSWQGTL